MQYQQLGNEPATIRTNIGALSLGTTKGQTYKAYRTKDGIYVDPARVKAETVMTSFFINEWGPPGERPEVVYTYLGERVQQVDLPVGVAMSTQILESPPANGGFSPPSGELPRPGAPSAYALSVAPSPRSTVQSNAGTIPWKAVAIAAGVLVLLK